MKDKIKKTTNNIKQSPFVEQTTCLAKTFWTIALILVPAALSAYLLITTKDTVVIIIGVASGVYALVNLVSTAYKANKISKKRK